MLTIAVLIPEEAKIATSGSIPESRYRPSRAQRDRDLDEEQERNSWSGWGKRGTASWPSGPGAPVSIQTFSGGHSHETRAAAACSSISLSGGRISSFISTGRPSRIAKAVLNHNPEPAIKPGEVIVALQLSDGGGSGDIRRSWCQRLISIRCGHRTSKAPSRPSDRWHRHGRLVV